MNPLSRHSTRIPAALALALVLAACQTSAQNAAPVDTGPRLPKADIVFQVTPGPRIDGPIKLGFIGSFSGPGADAGTAARRGFELAIDDWNTAGGFGGQKIESIVADDEQNPAKGIENTRRLAGEEKVAGLVGLTTPAVAAAAAEFAQQLRVPLVISGNGSEQVTARYSREAKNYIFGVRTLDRLQGKAILSFLTGQFATPAASIGIIYSGDAAALQSKVDIEAALTELGAAPCGSESVAPSDKDLAPLLQRLQESGCTAAVAATAAPETLALLQSAKKSGSKLRIIGTSTWGQPALYQLAGEDLLQGSTFVQTYTVDNDAIGKTLNDRLLAKYKEAIYPLYTAQAYDATALLLRAIADAGSTDSGAVQSALESIAGFKGTTRAPAAPFTKTEHEALGKPETYILATWKNAAIVTAT